MIGKPTFKNEVDFHLKCMGTPDADLVTAHTFIPTNRYGVRSGYYHQRDIVKLIRSAAKRPATVRFIADMME